MPDTHNELDIPEEWKLEAVYVLGYSSPASFEEVRRTSSKQEAEDWVLQPSGTENLMNAYAIESYGEVIEPLSDEQSAAIELDRR